MTLVWDDGGEICAHKVLLKPITMNGICRYNQTGYCKQGRHCQKRHVEEICTDGRECKIRTCVRRHPKICKYFEKQSECRFDECAYAHEKDVKTVKIEFLESKIVELKADIIILEKNFCNENKILSEQVTQLNNSISNIYQKFEKTDNHKKVIETKLSQQATGKMLNFRCHDCGYESGNKITFQKHCNTKHAAKHKSSVETNHKCSLCRDEFSTKEDLDNHKAEHLEEIESMDVASLTNGHDIFECNLCSFDSVMKIV